MGEEQVSTISGNRAHSCMFGLMMQPGDEIYSPCYQIAGKVLTFSLTAFNSLIEYMFCNLGLIMWFGLAYVLMEQISAGQLVTGVQLLAF